MTRVLVVYESMFGNTEKIANAIAEGLAGAGAVDVVEVGSAPTVLPEDVDLLVVGAPTHAFGLSRPSTRKSAADQAVGDLVSTGIGVREWLDELRSAGSTALVAAFDTRVKIAMMPGSAARRALGRLRGRGFPMLVRAESFHVVGTPGPLKPGEADRAKAWGAKLAAALSTRQHTR
ncbi:flavodoxin family protein [Umezawaea endophytica]|uniref:Flavodoxin family protein n=1 Tax=Umezawaea endophytica TaxID=1654476 RepID=A0A9X2VX11_9PSEU|nr:flavodoxin family protein [Umezawaea endophytica]MCS7483697.1 flavodoxin family protein [Umezawaea endophytica]